MDNNNKSNTPIYIGIAVVVLVVIGIVLYFTVFNKNKSQSSPQSSPKPEVVSKVTPRIYIDDNEKEKFTHLVSAIPEDKIKTKDDLKNIEDNKIGITNKIIGCLNSVGSTSLINRQANKQILLVNTPTKTSRYYSKDNINCCLSNTNKPKTGFHFEILKRINDNEYKCRWFTSGQDLVRRKI